MGFAWQYATMCERFKGVMRTVGEYEGLGCWPIELRSELQTVSLRGKVEQSREYAIGHIRMRPKLISA